MPSISSPPLRRSGAAGPEVSHTWSFLPDLADVARVNSDCRALLPHMFGELRIELQPVERLPEVLAEPALTGVRKHNDVQNHGLDDEITKRFV